MHIQFRLSNLFLAFEELMFLIMCHESCTAKNYTSITKAILVTEVRIISDLNDV